VRPCTCRSLTPDINLPPLPQFVENKYHIQMNASAVSQMSRAIATGSEKGLFNLPKGEQAVWP